MDGWEDIIEKIKAYEKLHAEGESTRTKKDEKEVAAASKMRLQALETFIENENEKKLLALRKKLARTSVRSHEAVRQIP